MESNLNAGKSHQKKLISVASNNVYNFVYVINIGDRLRMETHHDNCGLLQCCSVCPQI